MNTFDKIQIMLGFFFMGTIVGAVTIWGFVSVYLRSYYYWFNPVLTDSVEYNIVPLLFAIWISYISVPFLVRNFNPHISLALCAAFKIIGYLGYLIAETSGGLYFSGFVVSYVEHMILGVCGFYIVSLFKEEKGKIISFMVVGVGFNVLIWSYYMTNIINPDNISANAK